jgi:hypothetical protein
MHAHEYSFLERFDPLVGSYNVPVGNMFAGAPLGKGLKTEVLSFRPEVRDQVLESLRKELSPAKGYTVAHSGPPDSAFWTFMKPGRTMGLLFSATSADVRVATEPGAPVVFPGGCRVTVVRRESWLERNWREAKRALHLP